MENKGLLFIPDISGFTKFVNEMEIEHTRLIIQELLEILINANHIGLEISEIEGDAILFYKFGASPDLKELYQQVEKMFCEFHKSLIDYDNRRFCQCGGCKSAINLTLKVITHYGEFTDYQVKNFKKLIGKDIIVAHQLLKNDIDQHEYWLVTKKLLENTPPINLEQWLKWDNSVKETDNGEVYFHYTQLGGLKREITLQSLPQTELLKKVKMVAVSKEYETDPVTLFHAVGDFNFRNRWRENVKAVEEINQVLPRVGMRCRCIFNDGQEIIYTTSYAYLPEKIEFSETEEKQKSLTHYLIEKTGDHRVRLTLNFYIKKNFVIEGLFKLTKKNKLELELKKSLINLELFLQDSKIPLTDRVLPQ